MTSFSAAYVYTLVNAPATALRLTVDNLTAVMVPEGLITQATLDDHTIAGIVDYQDLIDDGASILDSTHVSDTFLTNPTVGDAVGPAAFVFDCDNVVAAAATSSSARDVVIIENTVGAGALPAVGDRVVAYYTVGVVPNGAQVNFNFNASGVMKLGNAASNTGWGAFFCESILSNPQAAGVPNLLNDSISALLWPAAFPPTSTILSNDTQTASLTALATATGATLPTDTSHDGLITGLDFNAIATRWLVTANDVTFTPADIGTTFDFLIKNGGDVAGTQIPIIYYDLSAPLDPNGQQATITWSSNQVARLGGFI